jgi:hypothetical protein
VAGFSRHLVLVQSLAGDLQVARSLSVCPHRRLCGILAPGPGRLRSCARVARSARGTSRRAQPPVAPASASFRFSSSTQHYHDLRGVQLPIGFPDHQEALAVGRHVVARRGGLARAACVRGAGPVRTKRCHRISRQRRGDAMIQTT